MTLFKVSIISLIFVCSAEATSDLKVLFGNQSCSPPINCPYIPKGSQQKQCCSNLTENFYCSWRREAVFLTRFLETLKSWNCTEELEFECKERHFAWTDFTKIVYLSVCDHNELERKCFNKIASLSNTTRNDATTWKSAIQSLSHQSLKDEDLLEACVQISMYENNRNNFVETVEFNFQLCDLVWSGFDRVTLQRRDIPLWTLLPSRCKMKLDVLAVIVVLLGVVGLIVNLTLITVVYVTPSLHHNQYVYKSSIAVSDIVMSLLVFPSLANNVYTQAYKRFQFREVDLTSGGNQTSKTTAFVREKQEFFSKIYLNFFGLFSLLVVFVSIYTLLLATGDRLYAVLCPFHYRRTRSTKTSLYLSLLVWIVGIFIAIVPTLTSHEILDYSVNSRALIIMHGSWGSVFYGALLGVPIPVMWFLCILTFAIIKKNSHKMNKHKIGNENKQNAQEVRLAITLLLMVGSFTLSVLPFAILILYDSFFIVPNLDNPDEVDLDQINTLLSLEFFAFTLFMFNTMWNFFIYNARNQQFRTACLKLIQKLLLIIRCISFHNKITTYIGTQSSASHRSRKVYCNNLTLSKSVLKKNEETLNTTAANSIIEVHNLQIRKTVLEETSL